MLTRKDFKGLAQIIKKAKEDYNDGCSADSVLQEIQNGVTEFCREQNDRFNERLFNIACLPDNF